MNQVVFFGDSHPDPYLTLVRDISPRCGFTALDEFKSSTSFRRTIPRTWEIVSFQEERRFQRDPETILCAGAALGVDRDGVIGHFWSVLAADEALRQNFLGFLLATGETEIVVRTRGSILLSIPEVRESDCGQSVHVLEPNLFQLGKHGQAGEIGVVRYVERPGMAAVAFRRHGDLRPLDLPIVRENF